MASLGRFVRPSVKNRCQDPPPPVRIIRPCLSSLHRIQESLSQFENPIMTRGVYKEHNA